MMEEGEGENDDEIDRLLAAQRLAEECPLWDEYFIGEQTAEYIQNCVDLGAEVSPTYDHQQYPLHRMIQFQNVAGVRVLLKAGADPNATHRFQHTALHYAVGNNGSLAMIELLLEYRADPGIHSRQNEGQTVLHELFEYYQGGNLLTVLNLLLDHGADVTGNSPHSHDGKTPFHFAVRWGEQVLQALLDAGADINAQSRYGETALHYAVNTASVYEIKRSPGHQVRLEVVAFLLENGADPNLQQQMQGGSHPGATPFIQAMYARGDGTYQIPLAFVQLFLNAGADPNIPTGNGWTALFFVGRGVEEEREDIERALIAAGADPTYTLTTQNGVQTYTCLTEECWVVQQGG